MWPSRVIRTFRHLNINLNFDKTVGSDNASRQGQWHTHNQMGNISISHFICRKISVPIPSIHTHIRTYARTHAHTHLHHIKVFSVTHHCTAFQIISSAVELIGLIRHLSQNFAFKYSFKGNAPYWRNSLFAKIFILESVIAFKPFMWHWVDRSLNINLKKKRMRSRSENSNVK